MKTITSLSTIIENYDALLLDLWGVIHDGTHLYPGVHEALTQMRAQGKKIAMISNAPRRARKVELVLNGLGIEPALYDVIVSSGEAGFQWLAKNSPSLLEGEGRDGGYATSKIVARTPHLDPPPQGGRKYYYIGPARDADVIDGLDYVRVDDIKEADFLLNVGFGTDEQSTQDWMPLLRAAQALKLPMLCLNPDLEVVKITGERYACAGVIAKAYEQIKGEVLWFGKPYPAVYGMCMEALFPSSLEERGKILVIGDSLDTDIPGAINNGFDSVLVTGGILKNRKPEEIAALCRQMNLEPTYVMPALKW